MNKQLVKIMWLAVFFVAAVFPKAVLAEPLPAEEKKGRGVGKEGREARGAMKGHPMADLSQEDKAAVRKALQSVWENPEVLQARDEVKRATETFRAAIKKAMQQEDPRVAKLVEKMHRRHKPEGDMHGGRPPKGRPPRGLPPGSERGPRAPEDMKRGIGPEGFMGFFGDLSEDEKERLKAARQKALESQEFKEMEEKLKALMEEGAQLRKKRVQMFQQTKKEMAKAMIQVDPGVEPLLQRLKKQRPGRP